MPGSERDEPLLLHSRVPPRQHGARLIDYLCARFPYLDRPAWLREIANGAVRVRGGTGVPELVLVRGDAVQYRRAHREPWVDDRIAVLHRDEALLVVDKPAHLPMHADGPFVRSTLVNLLRQRFPEDDLALVHRLDRETSGACVVPRTAGARAMLHAQFERGEVHKTYLAVVRGHVANDFRSDAPIGRARASAIAVRRSADAAAVDPKPAATSFTVLRHGPNATLLRCVPHTGRTHQIRVHLEAAGHALLGDKLYGRPDDDYLAFVHAVKRSGDPRTVARPGEPDRQLLHAAALAFVHPLDGARREFAAPTPAMFETWLLA